MRGTALKIRDIQNGDLERLCNIDRLCFPADIAFSRKEFLFHLNHPGSITRLMEREDSILGFVMGCIEDQQYAHVITLDVLPEARQGGIGTALMNVLHEEFEKKGIRAVILEVSIRNLPAQRLYEKLRYQYLGKISGYYRGREDAYRMARFL